MWHPRGCRRYLFYCDCTLIHWACVLGVGWTISAIGWLIIAAVVIPFCEQNKKEKGDRK